MFIFQVDHHREAGKVAVGEILTLSARRIQRTPWPSDRSHLLCSAVPVGRNGLMCAALCVLWRLDCKLRVDAAGEGVAICVRYGHDPLAACQSDERLVIQLLPRGIRRRQAVYRCAAAAVATAVYRFERHRDRRLQPASQTSQNIPQHVECARKSECTAQPRYENHLLARSLYRRG